MSGELLTELRIDILRFPWNAMSQILKVEFNAVYSLSLSGTPAVSETSRNAHLAGL